jgi:hypothetical protein
VTDPDATISGGYWFHGQRQEPHRAVADPQFRRQLVDALATATGITL